MHRPHRSFAPLLTTLVVALAGCNPQATPPRIPLTTTPATPPAVRRPTTFEAFVAHDEDETARFDAAVRARRPAGSGDSSGRSGGEPMPVSPLSSSVAGPSVPEFADPRQIIPFLASDQLAGRLPGSPGLRTAGDSLAGDFRRLGLAPPPGQADDFQPFTMRLSTHLDPATGLLLDGRPLTVGTDYDPINVSGEGSYRGPVAFAGYSITHKAADGRTDYDDYAGLDGAGKVVLAMMKEPLGPGNASRFRGDPGGRGPWSPAAFFKAKAADAAAHGAVALLLVSPPSSGGPDVVRPYFSDGDATDAASIPVVQVTRRVADLMLTTAGHADLADTQAKIDAAFAPASASLPDVAVTGEVDVKRESADVRNVIAALPGVGPHADEWVVVGAHYDHLGTGQLGHAMGPNTGLFHGADDNASGTAAVVDLAAQLKAAADAGTPLPRSVLFCLFTGEEEGLIGSDYYVRHPLVPLSRTVAMLNMDMVGRLRDDDLQIGGAGTARPFDAMVAAAVAGTGLKTSQALPDEHGRGGMGPSDHMSFALHRIPVLFLFTGLHRDYHRPTDTADKINYAGVDRIVTVARRLVGAMAAMPRPAYDASSDGDPTVMTASIAASGVGSADAGRAALGVVPDMAADAGGGAVGVPLSGVGPGTPAAAAGLRASDRLVGFGPRPLSTLQDLSDALASAKPGDKVDLKIIRDGQPITVPVTLAERKPH